MYLLHLGAIRYAHVKSPPLISEGGKEVNGGGEVYINEGESDGFPVKLYRLI